jgi:hypothetical protein
MSRSSAASLRTLSLESLWESQMPLEAFSGTWSFDPSISELKSPPSVWEQAIRIEGGRIRVREEITREAVHSVVEAEGAVNGEFYEVRGSPLVDEISYIFDGEFIHGSGRRQGVVVLREIVTLPSPDILKLSMRLFLGGKEMQLGDAVFRRK